MTDHNFVFCPWIMLIFSAQTNMYAVPWAVSKYGMHFQDSASHGQSITSLFIGAAKHNEELKAGGNPRMIQKMIESSPVAFTTYRTKFSAILIQYHATGRAIAAEILHAVFSMPRGAASTVDAEKLNAIHDMLNLRQGEALLDQRHPVCKDWDAEPGGLIKRIFVAGPKSFGYRQVFGRGMPPNSAQFHAALGNAQCVLLPSFSDICQFKLKT